jgi:hypothetical protein
VGDGAGFSEFRKFRRAPDFDFLGFGEAPTVPAGRTFVEDAQF